MRWEIKEKSSAKVVKKLSRELNNLNQSLNHIFIQSKKTINSQNHTKLIRVFFF